MTYRDEDNEIIDTALDTLAWQRREIERLTAGNERLREALTAIRDRKWGTMTQGCDAACEAAHLARAALGDTQ